MLGAPEYHFRPVSAGPPDRRGLQDIGRRARSAWSWEEHRRAKSSTVYGGEFGGKVLDEPSWRRMRPSSPTRMNKPHPPEVFLVTRLRYLPGYYNCEQRTGAAHHAHENASLGKSTPISNLKRLQHVRISDHLFCDSNARLAAQAWMKIASERDRTAVEQMINSAAAEDRKRKLAAGRKSYMHQKQLQWKGC
ncbi:uncharacterized protein [Ambystoma mexicanum]|uniref:uncharacterized protein isoform X2 n=1 Tax=Ambystoma mexicanum TaxID=8296 RepID=UPI0037E899B9